MGLISGPRHPAPHAPPTEPARDAQYFFFPLVKNDQRNLHFINQSKIVTVKLIFLKSKFKEKSFLCLSKENQHGGLLAFKTHGGRFHYT